MCDYAFLVLCAIEGTQHSNQNSGVLAAARVLPVRVAMANMCEAAAFASRGGLASGRALGEWSGQTSLSFGGKILKVESRSLNQILSTSFG